MPRATPFQAPPVTIDQAVLADVLTRIEQHDTDYEVRYGLVFTAVDRALRCGYRAGVKNDPEQPEWPVVYIDLPTGQVSWHMPEYAGPWDGHSTKMKYDRIRAYVAFISEATE